MDVKLTSGGGRELKRHHSVEWPVDKSVLCLAFHTPVPAV